MRLITSLKSCNLPNFIREGSRPIPSVESRAMQFFPIASSWRTAAADCHAIDRHTAFCGLVNLLGRLILKSPKFCSGIGDFQLGRFPSYRGIKSTNRRARQTDMPMSALCTMCMNLFKGSGLQKLRLWSELDEIFKPAQKQSCNFWVIRNHLRKIGVGEADL